MITKLYPIIVSDDIQIFNGKKYYRRAGKKYFTRGDRRELPYTTTAIHRDVWEYHNPGTRLRGTTLHVHHLDGNPSNNAIENLECLPNSNHVKKHWDDPEWHAKQVAVMKRGKREKLGEDWHSKRMHEIWAKRPPKTYTCARCGKSYERVYVREYPKMYCSAECRKPPYDHDKYMAKRIAAGKSTDKSFLHRVRWRDFTCHECGKGFSALCIQEAKYCSKQCGWKFHIKKKAAKLKAMREAKKSP